MMEKALGVQLFTVWSEMSDLDKFYLVKQLTKFEGEMTKIRLPANGSLCLRESMSEDDKFIVLDTEVDPSREYCIGPTWERRWYEAHVKRTSVYSQFDRGRCE